MVCTGFGNPPPKCIYHPNASNRDEPSGLFARFARRLPPDVPEHILWMQSGHAQDAAARRYVRLGSPALLYDTWAAFGL